MTIETLKVIITAETSKLNDALKTTTSGLKSTEKQAKKTSSNAGKEFAQLGKKFAIAHLAVQLIMKAIQKLGQMLKQGISNAYEYSKAMGGDFAKSVDKFKDSVSYLTNALGSALVPILNAILPTVTAIVTKLGDFANEVGKVVAAITGQESFTQAKKGVESYTEAVKKATMGFDELNIVDSGKKEEKEDPAKMFEEVKVDKSLADIPKLFDKIKKSVSGAVGEVNKFFKDTDWKRVGKDISDVLNGIIETLDTIFVETDWETIGQSLMDSLMSFIENVDWGNIVHTIFDLVVGALRLVKGLVENIDWDVWFDALFDIIFTTLDELINGNFLVDLMETLGVLVGKLIQGFITLWKKKIELFSQIITAIGDYFDGKIEECGGDVGAGILKGIGDALKDIGTWIYDKLIGPLLDGIADGLGLEGGRNAILDIFETAFTNVKIFFENVGIFFENVWNGMWNGIGRGLVTALNFLIQKLNDFVRWVTDGPVGDLIGLIIDITGGDRSGLEAARQGRLVTYVTMPEQYINKAYKDYKQFNIQTKSTSTATTGGSASLPALNYKSGKMMNTVALMAQGGVVDRATNIIAGENGREAIVPLENNTEWIDMLAEKINAGTPSRITLNVDGKQLGYAVINNINNITKQTGSLQLSLA